MEAGGESGSAGAEDVPEGGDGGRGGEPDQPLLECNEDADCDDGKACTGEEVCSEGKCELGAAPCENADPDHCDVECVEGESGAACSVSAFDEDGDGYGTVACVASPGGDCDDTPGSGGAIFPGALEVCNQNVDDDCDGLDDASDDIVLPGVAVELVSSQVLGTTQRGQAALSHSYNPGFGFGIAWIDFRHQDSDTTSEIYFRTMGATGALGAEQRFTDAATAKDKRVPSIVANAAGAIASSGSTPAARLGIGGPGRGHENHQQRAGEPVGARPRRAAEACRNRRQQRHDLSVTGPGHREQRRVFAPRPRPRRLLVAVE